MPFFFLGGGGGGGGGGLNHCGMTPREMQTNQRDVQLLVIDHMQETSDNRRGRSEKVLVLPYDIRIPKIRISTCQAEELRSHRCACACVRVCIRTRVCV